MSDNIYFYIYKITNLANNKIYIGAHQSNSLLDDYMGSGLLIGLAKTKYGIENFKKEILFVYNNKEDMYDKEKELVNESFIKSSDNYNLKIGGNGGWDYINNNSEIRSITSKKRVQYHIDKMKNDPDYNKLIRQKIRDALSRPEIRNKIDLSIKIRKELNYFGTFTGKKHSENTKKKISNSLIGKQVNEKNSQYGTMWIYSLEEKRNMKISKSDKIPNGWYKGRKMKF